MQKHNLADNENGFVLVASLLILMILLVIGIAATNTTTIELQIAGNEISARDNFYKAEAAAYEIAQQLENDNADDLKTRDLNGGGITNDGLADKTNIANYENINKSTLLTTDPKVGTATLAGNYLAVDLGVSGGSSMDMSSASLIHSYDVYGRVAPAGSSEKIIEIGYKKRF